MEIFSISVIFSALFSLGALYSHLVMIELGQYYTQLKKQNPRKTGTTEIPVSKFLKYFVTLPENLNPYISPLFAHASVKKPGF